MVNKNEKLTQERAFVNGETVTMANKAWWGFDCDGTIAHYESWGDGSIGAPIKPMIRRIKHYLNTGRRVAIVTARVHPNEPDAGGQNFFIRAFLEQALGSMALAEAVDIRADKDRHMVALFDDRAEQVIPNTGILVREELRRAVQALTNIATGAPHAYIVAQETLDYLDSWSKALAGKE
jgi:hypothetical protein